MMTFICGNKSADKTEAPLPARIIFRGSAAKRTHLAHELCICLCVCIEKLQQYACVQDNNTRQVQILRGNSSLLISNPLIEL